MGAAGLIRCVRKSWARRGLARGTWVGQARGPGHPLVGLGALALSVLSCAKDPSGAEIDAVDRAVTAFQHGPLDARPGVVEGLSRVACTHASTCKARDACSGALRLRLFALEERARVDQELAAARDGGASMESLRSTQQRIVVAERALHESEKAMADCLRAQEEARGRTFAR